MVSDRKPRRRFIRRGTDPLQDDSRLAYYGVGLFNGEGGSVVRRPKGQRCEPTLQIAMYSKDALEHLAKWWGVSVTNAGKDECKRDPANPSGRAFMLQAKGLRAKIIMDNMISTGFLSGEKKRQWEHVLRECPL